MSARGVDIPVVFKSDTKGLKDADDALGRIGGGLKNFGIAAGVAFAAAAAGAVAFGASSLRAAADAEAITRGLENATKNAGLFGDTAADIDRATAALDDHSTKLAELTGIDDEIINQIKTGWLAVPSLAALGVDGLNNLADVVADTAAGTGKDVQAIGLAFQRVAGDTESAFSKLSRAGIVFTDEQKATFDSLLETNGEMAAQQYLIEQLGTKYEGAAEAAANPFARLQVIFENLKETIGKAFLPAIEKLVPIVADFVNNLTASPEFQAFIDGLAIAFGQLVDAVLPLLPPLLEMITSLMPTIIELITLLAPVVLDLFKAFEPLLPVFMQLVETLLPPLVELVGNFIKMIVDNPNFLGDVNKNFETMAAIIEPLRWTLQTIADLLGQIGGKAKIIDGLEARARAAQTAVNPFSLGSSASATYKGNFGGPAGAGPMKPFATGGIVMGPTNALIGEAGPEAVIPLDKLSSVMGRGSGINITVNAGMGADGAALGEQIVTAIRKYERSSGAVFARA